MALLGNVQQRLAVVLLLAPVCAEHAAAHFLRGQLLLADGVALACVLVQHNVRVAMGV